MAYDEKIGREDYYIASACGRQVSFHSLKDFAADGAAYHRRITGEDPDPEPSEEMMFGTAAHTLILEGERAFEETYTIATGPINAKTGRPYGRETKAFQDWLATQPQDKPFVTDADAKNIRAMRDAVFANDPRTGLPGVAAQLLARGRAEIAVRFSYRDVACQSLIDWVNPNYADTGRTAIVDLKTCADVAGFVWYARQALYIHQLAFYRTAVEATTGTLADCYIIAVEKKPRPRVAVFMIPSADLDEASFWIDEQLDRLHACRENGVWPTGYEDLRELTLYKK